MSEELDFESSAISLPAGDIKAEKPTGDIYATRTFPIHVPNEDRNDFVIEIRASQIIRCRSRLEKLTLSRFPLHELLLSIATLLLGATLGAFASDITLLEARGAIFLIVFPIIGCSTLVAYFFLRRDETASVVEIAQEALIELPDPKNTSSKE